MRGREDREQKAEVGIQKNGRLRRKMIAQNDYNRIYAAAEKQSKMFSGCAGHYLGGNSHLSTRDSSTVCQAKGGRL
jgi:hypothetical protein